MLRKSNCGKLQTTEIVFGEDKVFKEDNQHWYVETGVYDVAEKKQNKEPPTTDLPELQIVSFPLYFSICALNIIFFFL